MTLSPQASKQSSASAASGAKSLCAMNAGRLNLRMALLTSQNDMYTIGRGSGEMFGGDACTLQVKKPTVETNETSRWPGSIEVSRD